MSAPHHLVGYLGSGLSSSAAYETLIGNILNHLCCGGAIRVHGGGFAGTIQAFVPKDKLEHFKSGVESLLGPGTCHVLHIRPQGGCVIVG